MYQKELQLKKNSVLFLTLAKFLKTMQTFFSTDRNTGPILNLLIQKLKLLWRATLKHGQCTYWFKLQFLDRCPKQFNVIFHLLNCYITLQLLQLLHYDICVKTSGAILQYLTRQNVSAELGIVTQPRFRENSFYVKLTAFFTAKNIKFDTKITTNSESLSKMNMKSRLTVLPTSAVNLHSKSFV